PNNPEPAKELREAMPATAAEVPKNRRREIKSGERCVVFGFDFIIIWFQQRGVTGSAGCQCLCKRGKWRMMKYRRNRDFIRTRSWPDTGSGKCRALEYLAPGDRSQRNSGARRTLGQRARAVISGLILRWPPSLLQRDDPGGGETTFA